MLRSIDQDIALPLAWPDQTARGDEKWMRLLKRIGLVKNLNFRVGHAAVVLISRTTGQICYFDFGRYITPRGYGRARSAAFDPRLRLYTIARFDRHTGKLSNLEEILAELHQKEYATHGGGRLLCSICENVSFAKGIRYAEDLVNQGPILYGALARNNNSCSRYVAQILVKAMSKEDPRVRLILFPEFVKASPTSNVVNASTDRTVYCYANGILEKCSMRRFRSFVFQVNLLKDNFTTSGAQRLSDDRRMGQISEPPRVAGVPADAQWLGGIGEGKWFVLHEGSDGYEIRRYDMSGRVDYAVFCQPDQPFDASQPYTFTFDVHCNRHVVRQGTTRIAFLTQTSDIAPLKQVEYQSELCAGKQFTMPEN